MTQKELLVQSIETQEDFDTWMERSLPNNGDLLLIIDIFKSWSGPCDSLLPAFRDIQKKHPDTLAFLSVEVPKFAQKLQELECVIVDCGGGERKNAEEMIAGLSERGCSPIFIAVR